MNPQTLPPASDKAVTPNPMLADLQDIIIPDPIGAWPWAVGYWLVLAILLVLIISAILWLKKRAAYLAPKKAAQGLFAVLDPNSSQYASEVNQLLKRTALSYLPREEIAKLDGPAWATWLDSHLPAKQRGRIGPLLGKRHQAKPLSADEARELQALARSWFASKAKLSAPIMHAATNPNPATSAALTPAPAKPAEEQC
ncbi:MULTISPECIES: DUF4381 domain-containing protein [Shewanella]|uniref:DUF4381 domain-containing protein n=1 Tax=Shewanella xiamenensis TaxID=332186 RepID=A0AAW6QUI4_9GAMM|nr:MULTISPECIES: DUF4381 domain-containing protein [Shewanella]MCT8868084.1 DUF4381 domain-containing protein [Shewanella xiamenensis]MDG5899038.1 DUF4381 domain-containing protein [Shewanella xiamenensis]MDL3983858.1 DUF4381 domain-containing protein [Shewanella xiamenensis]NSM23890.1 DUF4381 domain-containing protein [Shewanella sp. ZOR0012]QQK59478.1 DUF4381 domain-containing protein [Shewanella sp. LC6]